MRIVMTIIILIVVAGTIDAFYFHGRYRQNLWQEATYQGQQVRNHIDSLVKKAATR